MNTRGHHLGFLFGLIGVLLLAAGLFSAPTRAALPSFVTTPVTEDNRVPAVSTDVLRAAAVHSLVLTEDQWTPSSLHTEAFADVPPGSLYWAAITAAYAHGVISGFVCGAPGEACDPQHRPYFRPRLAVTRGELAQMISRAKRWALVDRCPATTFRDVPCGSPFNAYIETVHIHGVMDGYGDGTFRPYNPVTQAELSTLLPGVVSALAGSANVALPTPFPTPFAPPEKHRDGSLLNPLTSSSFGTNVQDTKGYYATGGTSQGQLTQLHTQIVRTSILWDYLVRFVTPTPIPANWDWNQDGNQTETVLSELEAKGIKVSLILSGAPIWECSRRNGNTCLNQDGPPLNYADYYEFVRQAVSHYTSIHHNIAQVEIQNEPDSIPTWGLVPDQYATFLCNVYNQIRTVSQVPVIMGGLGFDNFGSDNNSFARYFFPYLLQHIQQFNNANNGNWCTDAINFHHYAPSSAWGPTGSIGSPYTPGTLLYDITGYMRPYNMTQPLIQTESGISSNSADSGSSVLQAALAAKLYPWMLSQSLRQLYWYNLYNFVPETGYFADHGLIAVTPTPAATPHCPCGYGLKDAYYANQQSMGLLESAAYRTALTAATNFQNSTAGEGYSFVEGGDYHGLVAAWNAPEQGSVNVTFPGKTVQWVQDLYTADIYGPPGNFNPPPAPSVIPLPVVPGSVQPFYFYFTQPPY